MSSKYRFITMNSPCMGTNFRLPVRSDPAERGTYTLREESSSNRFPALRHMARQNISHSRMHPQSLLDTSAEIGHFKTLREGDWIGNLALPCELVDLVHQFGVDFRVGDDVVEDCAEGDARCVGAGADDGHSFT